jgi:hypothetical protein
MRTDYTVVKNAGPYKGLVLVRSNLNPLYKYDTNIEDKDIGLSWWSWTLSWLGIQSTTNDAAAATNRRPVLPAFDRVVNGIHVVLSHCDSSIDWVWDRMLVMNDHVFVIKSITLLSYCDDPVRVEAIPTLPDPYPIQSLHISDSPKTEKGNDNHSYLYWIANVFLPAIKKEDDEGQLKSNKLYHPNDQVLFVKDTDNKVYHRANGPTQNMLKFRKLQEQSQRYGFSCGNRIQQDDPETIALNICDKKTTGSFCSGDRCSTTFQKWVDDDLQSALNITAGKDTGGKPVFMPLCLGGHFMTTIDRILNSPVSDWGLMVQSLREKPDNERLMERLWALLLSTPISVEEQRSLLNQEYRIISKRRGGNRLQGVVTIKKKYEPPMPNRKKRGWKEKRKPFLIQWMQQQELLNKYW